MIFFSNKSRPYHLGPYPLERIARDLSILEYETAQPRSSSSPAIECNEAGFAGVLEKYHQIFHGLRNNEAADAKAPVPDSKNIFGA